MNLNDQASDEVIARALDLERYKRSTVNRMLAILRAVDKDILEEISKEGLTDYQHRRIGQLLRRIRTIVVAAYAHLGDKLTSDLAAMVEREIVGSVAILNSTVGVSWANTPSINQVYTAAYARPFQGALLRDHIKQMPVTVVRLIDRQLRIAYAEGESQSQIHARVNLVLKGQRTNYARSITNTAINHFQSFALRRVYEQNSDALKGIKLSATLDTNTSSICRARDGRVYELSKAPHLPFHYNERSQYVPVLKSWKQQKFDVPEGTRSSMDGKVSQDLNFKQWVDRQSFDRQTKALGTQPAKILRDSDLTIDDLFTNDRQLKVYELRERFPKQVEGALGV